MNDEVVKTLPAKHKAQLHPYSSIQHTDEAKAFNAIIRVTHLLNDPHHITILTYRLLVGWMLGPEPALHSWEVQR